MADTDLKDPNVAQPVKLVGAGASTGVTDNFLDVDSVGRITIKLTDANGNPITTTANGDLYTTDVVNNSGVQGQIAVAANTATAVRVGGTNLANRKRLLFTPISGTIAYWGFSNAVTNANGFPVYKNQPVSDSWGPNTTIWIYSTTAITVAVAEGA